MHLFVHQKMNWARLSAQSHLVPRTLVPQAGSFTPGARRQHTPRAEGLIYPVWVQSWGLVVIPPDQRPAPKNFPGFLHFSPHGDTGTVVTGAGFLSLCPSLVNNAPRRVVSVECLVILVAQLKGEGGRGFLVFN